MIRDLHGRLRALSSWGSTLLLALLPGISACRCQASGGTPRRSSARESRKRSIGLAPLRATSPRIDLSAKGFNPAVVMIPLGATDSRPVLIVLHGDSADPQAVCESWREVSKYGFLLCPRGVVSSTTSGSKRYGFGGVHDAVLELRAGLGALRKRFGDYVAPGPVVLAGASLGARLAVAILRQEPAYFAHVILVEHEHDPWGSGVATIFARRGGRRALFVCVAPACAQRIRDDVVLTRRAGARARSIYPGDFEESDPRLARGIAPGFRWLIADDPNWKPPAPHH